MTSKGLYDKLKAESRRSQKKIAASRFYKLNSILGNKWAVFYVITGGRMTGKSYSVTDFLCNQKKKLGPNVKNYWMRISETSTKAMLTNKADKLVDPDLKRKYNLDLTTKGMDVYNHGKEFMTVIPLSGFAKLKGVGFFDKDFNGWYNLVLDEFQLEQGEKRTSFDILYNFIGMIENIARTTKNHIRVFLLGNTLEEASTILKAFNFIPDKFGRFYLKSKRCVIDNLEPTEEYLNDRKGSLADILGGDSMSNYTNELNKDRALLYKGRVKKPVGMIKFGKSKGEWYVIWDSNIIKRYKGEGIKKANVTYMKPYLLMMLLSQMTYHSPLDLPNLIKRYKGEGIKKANVTYMKPYLDGFYSKERVQLVIDMYDAQAWKFDSLITQSYFSDALKMIRLK